MSVIKRSPTPPGPITELFDRLHDLRFDAGEPAIREIARRTSNAIVYSTVHLIFKGPRVPSWGKLELIVEALEGSPDEFRVLHRAALREERRRGGPSEAAEAVEEILAGARAEAARLLAEAQRLRAAADPEGTKLEAELEAGRIRDTAHREAAEIRAAAESAVADAHSAIIESQEVAHSAGLRQQRLRDDIDRELVSLIQQRDEVRAELDHMREVLRQHNAASVEEPPPVPVFDAALRGYNREQVKDHLALLRDRLLDVTSSSRQIGIFSEQSRLQFVNLARRSQILVDRLIGSLDQMEKNEQDPDRLAELFHLDHLATRMRRNDENLLVLAGEESLFQSSKAAPLADVIRAAQSEIELYTKVNFGRIEAGIEIAPLVVHDLVRLLAELLDNATAFSPPDMAAVVEARRVGSAVQLIVEDRGIGMIGQKIALINDRLAHPPTPGLDIINTRYMGTKVISLLAAKHGIKVELKAANSNRPGVVALVTLPAPTLLQGATGLGQTVVAPSPDTPTIEKSTMTPIDDLPESAI
ncbi:hypothetical protein Lfu02_76060 [Longispora fulva]|uniref:histidine kinase n=1 Tax=Longispora fulva TaxID=619741 RepID=A0A8J7GTX8_9ACTN|nr:hypothetical protein [Longispora fulva]MBG6138389.1 hypothetical protein [Longispora fulva]GIG63234.1 hypothetical protein Lfu02_76060 [Longispora fulva]